MNELVLDCYRLAHFFHVSPTIFLDMPLSEVRVHLERSIDLAHALKRERADPDDG